MIKRAGIDDVEVLAKCGPEVLKDLPNYSGVPFDLEHTVTMLTAYIKIPGVGCFFKQNERGEVVGMLMGVIAPPWFTTQKEMAEIIFWIRKDSRTPYLAKQLMRAMEEWARSEGAVKLLMAAGSGYATDRVERFYNRSGYRTCGLSTCKELS